MDVNVDVVVGVDVGVGVDVDVSLAVDVAVDVDAGVDVNAATGVDVDAAFLNAPTPRSGRTGIIESTWGGVLSSRRCRTAGGARLAPRILF